MKMLEGLFTTAEYEQLPEGFPAQLIEGALVREPSPVYGHQELAAKLRFELLKLLGPSLVPDTPADVGIDKYNVFQPDIVVLERPPPRDAHCVGVPLLAIEVLSPLTAQRDRHVKTEKLVGAGVAEVWLVDRSAETVEIYTAEGSRRYGGQDRAASAAVPGFVVVPALLFGE
jgi:Uma2 family endonuclease